METTGVLLFPAFVLDCAGFSLRQAFRVVPALTLLLTSMAHGAVTVPGEGQGLVVPQGFAEDRGADRWDGERWQVFLRDPDNRFELEPAQVQARQARGPDQWLPRFDQCLYLSRFVVILERYGLDVKPGEMAALKLQRQRCYTQFQ